MVCHKVQDIGGEGKHIFSSKNSLSEFLFKTFVQKIKRECDLMIINSGVSEEIFIVFLSANESNRLVYVTILSDSMLFQNVYLIQKVFSLV